MIASASVKDQKPSLLGERFDYDGRPVLNLNTLQRNIKAQVEQKVDQGVYQFEREACCICGTTDADTLATKDRYGLYMPVVLCRECGLIYTNPRMDQQAYACFYNDEYRKLYGGTRVPTESFFKEPAAEPAAS